jgi:TonB family protein
MPTPRAVSLLLLISLSAIALANALAQDSAPATTRTIPSGTAGSLLIKRVPPDYPPLARQARIQGIVVLKVILNTSGDVESLQLVSGHPMLAPAAITAVKQWKYQPFLVDGQPVKVETTVQVNFTLAGNNPADSPQGGVIGELGTPGSNPVAPANPRVRVSEGVMRALRIQRIDPVYPPEALQIRLQGQVILSVQINASGEVDGIHLISGHPMLSPPAIEAVKQWTYKPYLLDGNPVPVDTIVRLSFTLTNDESSVQGSVEDSPVPKDSYSTQPAGAVPQRVRVSSGVSSGLILSKVNPIYPPDAREQRIQGVVVMQVEIDKEGNIENIQLISGHPMLAPAAIDAVKQWKYKPYLLNGNPVSVDTQVQVNFVLSRPQD